MPKPTSLRVGIDLGTTQSSVAWVFPDGQADILPDRQGERRTPSVVFFERGGGIVVGRSAAAEARIQPDAVIQSVKRYIGDPTWLREFGGYFYRPQDISSLILRKLKADADAFFRTSITEAVITVPAYFHDLQRSATLEAAESAGFSVLRLLNEPTAAAIAYRHQIQQDDGLYLIFDLGGGTCDLSIVEVSGPTIEIKATKGHAFLGGQDWDDLLVHALAAEFVSLYGVDPLDDPRSWQDLLDKAIQTKHLLSLHSETTISLLASGFSLRKTWSRKELEALSSGLLQEASDLCRMILEDAGLRWSSLRGIYLVGGATRMPMIPALLRSLSGLSPQTLLHPEDAVALGAAWHAASLPDLSPPLGLSSALPSGFSSALPSGFSSALPSDLSSALPSDFSSALPSGFSSALPSDLSSALPSGLSSALPSGFSSALPSDLSSSPSPGMSGPRFLGGRIAAYDITSHTLGLIVLDRQGRAFVDPILPRFSPLPASIQHTYYTAHDHQVSLEIRLVEGESREPNECTPLGSCEIKGLPARPSGQEIQITFDYNLSGILTLSLLDIGSGQSHRIEIQRQDTRPSHEIYHFRQRLQRLPLKP